MIGDRLLIVDAIQGFGVVDAPFQVADVIVSGGQKWVRAGWGTGFLALSDRALERLTPVFSGFAGTDVDLPLDAVLPPAQDARAYAISNPSPIAEARLAGALEQIARSASSRSQPRSARRPPVDRHRRRVRHPGRVTAGGRTNGRGSSCCGRQPSN